MPNWCEGVLKVRGKQRDLINFLNNGIERYGWPRDKEGGYTKYPLNMQIDKYGKCLIEETDKEHNSWLYFKDSRRCFIKTNVSWYLEEDEDDICIYCLDIQQAWWLEPDYFKEVSQQYNIDFRIIGIEMGAAFTQEIEIIKGEITLNNVTAYDLYKEFMWEVYDPRLGG